MEKCIVIDGKNVRFKSTAATLPRYKSQFGTDFLADCARIEEAEKDITKLDTMPFYQIIWVMAKTADPNIPDMFTWLDGFENFPIISIYTELSELIEGNMRVDRKNV